MVQSSRKLHTVHPKLQCLLDSFFSRYYSGWLVGSNCGTRLGCLLKIVISSSNFAKDCKSNKKNCQSLRCSKVKALREEEKRFVVPLRINKRKFALMSQTYNCTANPPISAVIGITLRVPSLAIPTTPRVCASRACCRAWRELISKVGLAPPLCRRLKTPRDSVLERNEKRKKIENNDNRIILSRSKRVNWHVSQKDL